MTLLEIIIVVSIIATLAAILGNVVATSQEKARVKQASIQISELTKALEIYNTDCGKYPATAEGLAALAKGGEATCQNWGPEPYVKKVPKDPWQRDFAYANENGNLIIMSYGRDGKPGGEGYDKDVTNQD